MPGREAARRVWVFIGCGEITARILPLLKKEDVGGLVLIDSDVIETRNIAHVAQFPSAIGKNKAVVLGSHMAKQWGWQLIITRTIPRVLSHQEVWAATTFLETIPQEWPRGTVIVEATDDPQAVRWQAIHVHTGLTNSPQRGAYAISVGAFDPLPGLVRESGRCPEVLSVAAQQAAIRFVHWYPRLISLFDHGYQGYVEVGFVDSQSGQPVSIHEFVQAS